ncbi:T9SS C-terminal target domain-containing protein [Lutibacter sp. HS1-25]|uniref:reprolysin-like metallopeptidase n=1 Tax=Lutibacter sp. HS1-25 TaxID=2485000 RepID=UPI001012FA56|nr:zinc-dependent metalloprotease family protein [Lutibacter sp. HS1-25]RXP64655.1 T9SS C-terminal target domain-containing protein [Lutibacter sp. HS1-25]
MKNSLGKNSLMLFMFFVISSLFAQKNDKVWNQQVDFQINEIDKIKRRSIPNAYEVYNLDINTLKQSLQKAPKNKGKFQKSTTIVSFPTTNGFVEKYEVYESSILDEQLQKQFPSIKSYVGESIENPGTIIRFSVSDIGLHAMIMQTKDEAVFIDPYTSDKKSYIVYAKKELPNTAPFVCKADKMVGTLQQKLPDLASKTENVNDGKLRTFRLAIATTGEYAQFQLAYNGIGETASEARKKEVVLSAINATMTRVNAIFERDVSLTMQLVANNASIIFLDPLTDGFTNDNGDVLINESQFVIDNNIGFSNYDIGHTFSTGGGGLATINSPCTTSKAKGITGSGFPVGDLYDIDFVAHEMGHQYGANHTFNSSKEGCGGGNRNDATAVEPGSGSTIMSYAGLCAPENVKSYANDYFHLVSVNEMWANITSGFSNCANITLTGNNTPTVDVLPTYTLPISTPFFLNATASDADGDVLTYTWEQLDTQITTAPPVATAIQGPVFRSYAPSTSSTRYFPNLNTVIAGQLSNTWEVLPSVARTMKFGVNVRDNNVNGGQSASRETTLTFNKDAGPFRVTSQSTVVSWSSGQSKEIKWDVANTNIAPINCTNVNIKLSVDGGYTYPYTLASNIANNGTANIVVPNVTSTLARIKVESVGNIFYAINAANINIQAKEFTITFSSITSEVCKPTNAVYNFTYNTFLGFNEVTTFTAAGNPAGTTVSFSPATATANNTNVVVTVSGTSNLDFGAYKFDIVGTSATTSLEKRKEVLLNVYDANLTAPILTIPTDNKLAYLKPYSLNWNANFNAVSYTVQLATDASFTTIVEQATVNTNSYKPILLALDASYYWRVKSINNCGESSYSNPFKFTTANEICNTYTSTDIPKDIPDNSSVGVFSTISVSDVKLITDVSVTLNITHSYVEDLSISLISPEGIVVLLSAENGGGGDNYTNTIFNDAATTSIVNGSAPFTGTYKPQLPLSFLNNGFSNGIWKLKVVDAGEADTGTINSWSLEICGIITDINDDDGDGVINDIDQCPNTPFGNTVDALGCFILPANNFEIKTVDETCPGKDNGEIIITALKNYNYTTTIHNVDYSFITNQTISNLPAGTYDFCIGVFVADENKTFEQCYNVTVEAGTIVVGKATVKEKDVVIDIAQGTAPFEVLVNGNLAFETNLNSFALNVNHGDLIEVKTSVACEGVFSKEIDLITEIIAYPNPTNGDFEIQLPTSKKEVKIELYNMQAQLISSKMYPVEFGKVQLSLQDNPTGIYISKVYLDKPVILKIVKK